MLRRSVCAAVVMLVIGGFLLAETITGSITKMDGNKITVRVFDKEKKGKGDEKEFTLTDKTEYAKKQGFKDDADVSKATKDDLLKAVEKAKEKAKGDKGDKGGKKGKGFFGGGVFSTLDVEDGKVKKLTIIEFKGFGGKKKKDTE